MRVLYFILAVTAISLFAIFWTNYAVKNEFKFDKLPERFKLYQSIDSSTIIKSKNLTMTLLLKSTEDIYSFLTPDNHVILFTARGVKGVSLYKLDTAGTIIDSLFVDRHRSRIVVIDGFVIDQKNLEYYSWSFDGSKQPIKIIRQNELFDWDVKKQKQQIEEIAKTSQAVYVDSRVEEPISQKLAADQIPTTQAMKTYAVLTYFLKNKCFQLYTTLDVSNHFPYDYTENLLLNSLFKRVNTKVSGSKEIIESPHITYQNFQKLKRENLHFSGGGGNAPGFTHAAYYGNLYTDIAFKNDTLKLKEWMYLDDNWTTSTIKINGQTPGTFIKYIAQPPVMIDGYMFYTNQQLNYALFSNDDKKIYIIKHNASKPKP